MEDFEGVYQKYNTMIYKVAFLYVKNENDALDIVQNTFIKYLKVEHFENEEHIKRWLLRTCINMSKNHLKSFWHKKMKILEDENIATSNQNNQLIEKVFQLPKQYKAVIYLYYYQGYHVKEIAEILKLSESNVKQRLKRGREFLKMELINHE